MIRKLLIANRGEIARRIVRTARRMGIATVAVYSDADAGALHVRDADEAIHIGPSPATESYLVIDKIIAAARATGADSVHPGYGFLSENADFADACAAAGLIFVGPTGKAMRALGGKAAAKEIAIQAGVPVVPGYQGEKQDARTLGAEAKRIGYPIMIKAVAGGGGRGMRLVEGPDGLEAALDSARREAKSAFGDDRVLIEKVVQRPRHVEVQVFGDRHGNVVHLFERDCTLQRRNQKVIEEAPAPGMSAELRAAMTGAAVKLARSVGYTGAGTVEFLVEGGGLGPKAPWYFIEMNTRLQVEHPVTEEITGLDLVEWQLRIAAGETLPLAQDAIKLSGHAIEVRLCAEDPAKGFMPSVGPVVEFWVPGAGEDSGVRLEAGIARDSVIPPHYDSMIAKLIAHDADRAAAVARLRGALRRTRVAGPRTNAAFLAALLDHPGVQLGEMDTGLIGREIDALTARRPGAAVIEDGVRGLIEDRVRETNRRRTGYADWFADRPHNAGFSDERVSPWDATDGFSLQGGRTVRYRIEVDGELQSFDATWTGSGRHPVLVPQVDADGGIATPLLGPSWVGMVTCGAAAHAADAVTAITQIPADGRRYVLADLLQTIVAWPAWDADAADDGHAGDSVRAPINGRVAKLFVAEGEAVEKGHRVAVVEAMKMEHVLHTTRAGRIGKVAVREGQQVSQGALVVALAEENA